MFYKVRLNGVCSLRLFYSLALWIVVVATLKPRDVFASASATVSENARTEANVVAQTGTQDPPTPEPQPLPPSTSEPVLPLPSLEDPGDPTSDVQIDVREIQVVGSTVFEPEELNAVVAPFENRLLSLADLQQAAAAVTDLYLREGYITSRAVLPDQAAEEGVVQLLVIEGKLTNIEVEGAERLQRYVRDRIALGNNVPLNQFELEDQLILLQLDPLLENVEASISAGSTLGESVLTVNVTEAKRFRVNLVADNYSPDSIGRERIGANISYLNPFGLGDEFFTSAYVAPGGDSNVYELGYRVPLNAKNGTLQLRFVPSNFGIVNPEEANIPTGLNIRGSADLYSFNFRQPLIRTPREEFALSSGFRYRSGETLISNFLVDSSAVSVIQLGQDYLRRDRRGAWAFQSQFSIGTGLFDATEAEADLPDGQFFSWRGQAQRVQLLGPNQTLVVQADLQFANDALLGSEQFIIGGGQSVRGYEQNALSGDNGFRFSIEDRFVMLRNKAEEPFLQVAPFLDLGVVWNNESNQFGDSDDFLLGSGVGIILNPLPQVDIRLDLGIPLIELEDVGNSDSSAQVHFQFVYSPQR